MLTSTIRPTERLVYSTRWFDDPAEPKNKVAIEIVISDQAHEERHEALSLGRMTLPRFLKCEVKSHPGASL